MTEFFEVSEGIDLERNAQVWDLCAPINKLLLCKFRGFQVVSTNRKDDLCNESRLKA